MNQDHLVTKELENLGALITANFKDLQNVDLDKESNEELKEDLKEQGNLLRGIDNKIIRTDVISICLLMFSFQ